MDISLPKGCIIACCRSINLSLAIVPSLSFGSVGLTASRVICRRHFFRHSAGVKLG